MRIYLSGKITGLDNYKENFERAESVLRSYGHTVINPCKMGDIYPDLEWDDYMCLDMALIRLCQAVYFLENWRNSKGSTIEHEYARMIGKELLYEGENGNTRRSAVVSG